MTQITHNLAATKQRIVTAARSYGRNPETIHLLAVSKRHSVAAINTAREAGQTHFGENFAVEAKAKIILLNDDLTWHFIGKIQSNKCQLIAQYFDWVHSLDRLKIARRLHQFRGAGKPLNVLIQINLSGKKDRPGVTPAEVPGLAEQVTQLSGLKLRGLMAMAPQTMSFTVQSEAFAEAHELYEKLNKTGLAMDSLSMGMSGDLEAAILNGATWVRIGTDIFGKREPD